MIQAMFKPRLTIILFRLRMICPKVTGVNLKLEEGQKEIKGHVSPHLFMVEFDLLIKIFETIGEIMKMYPGRWLLLSLLGCLSFTIKTLQTSSAC